MAITAAHTEGFVVCRIYLTKRNTDFIFKFKKKRSKAILDFPFEGRSCLFKDERDFPQSEVTVFKEYTQENCLLECRAKILLHKCGCLPYFYPRLDVFLVSILPEFEHLKNVTICSDWQNWTCLADSNGKLKFQKVQIRQREKSLFSFKKFWMQFSQKMKTVTRQPSSWEVRLAIALQRAPEQVTQPQQHRLPLAEAGNTWFPSSCQLPETEGHTLN